MRTAPRPHPRSVSPFLASLFLCTLIVLSGCRRKPAEPPPSPTPAVEVLVQPTAKPEAAGVPPQAAAVTEEASRIANASAYTQEMTQTLNEFLGDYIRQHKRIPKDVNEMVSLKLIRSVPALPSGKKWVIDQQTGKISAP